MSPAPTRPQRIPKRPKSGSTRKAVTGAATSGGKKSSYSRGYALGAGLLLLGIALILVGAGITASKTASAATDLTRSAARGDFEAVLDQGKNYIYDEDGFGLGPLDIRVVDRSGNEVPVRQTQDGIDYDIDAGNGTARLEFDVPSTNFYSIEINGDVRNVAVGNDVTDRIGPVPTVLGILGVLSLFAGAIALLINFVRHMRSLVMNNAAGKVGDMRERLAERASGQPDRPSPGSRAQGKAQTAFDRARAKVSEASGQFSDNWADSSQRPGAAEHGKAPTWADASTTAQSTARGQAQQMADSLQARIDQAEAAVTQSTAVDDSVGRVAGQADGVLAQIQERLGSGDSLRDIAADARDQVKGTLASEAQLARTEAANSADAARKAAQLQMDQVSAGAGVAAAAATTAGAAAAASATTTPPPPVAGAAPVNPPQVQPAPPTAEQWRPPPAPAHVADAMVPAAPEPVAEALQPVDHTRRESPAGAQLRAQPEPSAQASPAPTPVEALEEVETSWAGAAGMATTTAPRSSEAPGIAPPPNYAGMRLPDASSPPDQKLADHQLHEENDELS